MLEARWAEIVAMMEFVSGSCMGISPVGSWVQLCRTAESFEARGRPPLPEPGTIRSALGPPENLKQRAKPRTTPGQINCHGVEGGSRYKFTRHPLVIEVTSALATHTLCLVKHGVGALDELRATNHARSSMSGEVS